MKVSELSALRIENTALRIQVLQAQAQSIAAEQARYVEAARTEVQAPADYVLNTATMEFQALAHDDTA